MGLWATLRYANDMQEDRRTDRRHILSKSRPRASTSVGHTEETDVIQNENKGISVRESIFPSILKLAGKTRDSRRVFLR